MTTAEKVGQMSHADQPVSDPFDITSDQLPKNHRIALWREFANKIDWGGADDELVKQYIRMALAKGKELDLAFTTNIGKSCSLAGTLVVNACKADKSTSETEWRNIVGQIAAAVGIQPSDQGCVAKALPEVYYNAQRKDYWMRVGDIYVPYGVEMISRKLVSLGFSPKKGDDGSCSEVDDALLKIAEEYIVDAAGPFGGYMPGLHNASGLSILASKGYMLIEPASEGDFVEPKHIIAILTGLFGDSMLRFCAWLRSAYQDLAAGRLNGGLCLVIVGPPNTCKTLCLSRIITPILGGRAGNAALVMGKGSSFNDMITGCEVWLIDDGNPFDDYDTRRAFNGAIKEAVSTENVLVHGKGKAGYTMPLYRRMVVVCNEDSLESAPEITGSLRDKVLLLKGKEFTMPAGCKPLPKRDGTNAWEEFGRTIQKELPHFLAAILASEEVGELIVSRFGPEPWQDPDLVSEMSERSPLHLAAKIISESCLDGCESIEMNATDIFLKCSQGPYKAAAARLLKNATVLGNTMSSLIESKDYKGHFTRRKLDGKHIYTIKRLPEAVGEKVFRAGRTAVNV